jgi:hypothetical protein
MISLNTLAVIFFLTISGNSDIFSEKNMISKNNFNCSSEFVNDPETPGEYDTGDCELKFGSVCYDEDADSDSPYFLNYSYEGDLGDDCTETEICEE